MTIEQLRKDMIAAAKAKDKPRKDAISAMGNVIKSRRSWSTGEFSRSNAPQRNHLTPARRNAPI